MAEETKTTVEAIGEVQTGQESSQKQESILDKIRGLVGGGKKEETESTSLTGGSDPSTKKTEEKKDPETGSGTEKTYTQADLDAAIQAAVAEAAEKAKAQKEEQERLAKLTPEQRAEEEHEAVKKQNAELTDKLRRMELEQKAAAKLKENNLPSGLADFLDYTDETKMAASLEKIGKMYKEQLEAGIRDHLKGETPKGLGSAANLTDGMIGAEITKRIRGGM